MKKCLFLILLLAGFAFADELETVQMTPIKVTYADANAAALDVNTNSWAVTKDWVDIPVTFNGMKVMFYVYDPCGPNNATFSYSFYVTEKYCNAQKVADANATCGALQLSHDPISGAELNSGAVDPNYCWVDTVDTITTDWKGGVTAQNDGGLNDVFSMIFDRQSALKVWCRIYNRSSATMEVRCIAYGY